MSQTILAIDDKDKILDVIRYFLEREKYVVKTATDPHEGIRIAQEEGIDLVLLDIMMPGMDGYALCAALKEDDRTRDLPVIMLTAKAIILNTPKDFFYGLYGFLAKPFSKDQLLRIVKETLSVTKRREPGRFVRDVEGADGEA